MKDDLEQVMTMVRPVAKEHGISEGDRDGIWAHFVSR